MLPLKQRGVEHTWGEVNATCRLVEAGLGWVVWDHPVGFIQLTEKLVLFFLRQEAGLSCVDVLGGKEEKRLR